MAKLEKTVKETVKEENLVLTISKDEFIEHGAQVCTKVTVDTADINAGLFASAVIAELTGRLFNEEGK